MWWLDNKEQNTTKELTVNCINGITYLLNYIVCNKMSYIKGVFLVLGVNKTLVLQSDNTTLKYPTTAIDKYE
jgi:hypothetical protein